MTMGQYALAILLALGGAVSGWNLRLESLCKAGDPTGNDYSVVNASTFIDCSNLCDVNTHCHYVSFNGTYCVMYGDVSPCVGTIREVYQVDPNCATGWHRFRGSCYFVVTSTLGGSSLQNDECPGRGANGVAVNDDAEGVFLTELLNSYGIVGTTVWTDGKKSDGAWGWVGTNESMAYTDWKAGEPAGNGVCVAMNSDNGEWQSEVCGEARRGVCEMSLF